MPNLNWKLAAQWAIGLAICVGVWYGIIALFLRAMRIAGDL